MRAALKNIIPTTALFIEYKMKGMKRREERASGREVHASYLF